MEEVSPRLLNVWLVPLPQPTLLHLKVDSLDPLALPQDLDAPHILGKVLHQLFGVGAALKFLQAKVVREVIGEMDYQDAEVEPDVGGRLVETLSELKVVKETVFVEVSTFHQVGYLISEDRGNGRGREGGGGKKID